VEGDGWIRSLISMTDKSFICQTVSLGFTRRTIRLLTVWSGENAWIRYLIWIRCFIFGVRGSRGFKRRAISPDLDFNASVVLCGAATQVRMKIRYLDFEKRRTWLVKTLRKDYLGRLTELLRTIR